MSKYTKSDFHVGQKLYYLYSPYGGDQETRSITIEKIGNKLLHAGQSRKPRIEDLFEQNEMYTRQYYLSKQEILDENECERLKWSVRDRLNNCREKFNLAQLRQIAKILNIDNKD